VFIGNLMDSAARDHQRHGHPITAVVFTCRRIDELKKLSRSGFGFPMPYHRVDVTAFDDDEVAQLILKLDSNVRSRIARHLQLPGWQTRQLPTRSEGPISTDAMEIIRHPVVWRFFAESDTGTQHACLDAVRGLDQLGDRYFAWFCEKAEMRISGLRNRECSEALLAVCQRFEDNTARVGERGSDWLNPCDLAGCSQLNAKLLLDEAITAGILIEEESDGRRWRWKHKWLCEYLLRARRAKA
jgi:hypothetical protein